MGIERARVPDIGFGVVFFCQYLSIRGTGSGTCHIHFYIIFLGEEVDCCLTRFRFVTAVDNQATFGEC